MGDAASGGPIVGYAIGAIILGLLLVFIKNKDGKRSNVRMLFGILSISIGVIVLVSALFSLGGVLIGLAVVCEVVRNILTVVADAAGGIASYLRQQAR